jgi:predicted nucleic acid-binding protein
MKYVLDACALLAYYNDEDGADYVEDILSKALNGDVAVSMHKVNLFEVYYDFLRSAGEDMANSTMASFESAPIKVVGTIANELMREAAKFKTSFKISVADAFALATAKLDGATLVTADHHEFDPIDKAGELEFLWIR